MEKKTYRIGYIGNFIPPFSTENDRKWSFEKLGHQVTVFQENKTTAEMLLNAMPILDMLVYSHTHDPSYIIKDLIHVFNEYKKVGIPTVSVHLDRWAWLDRVKDVGKEATWFTQYIFMADASPEAVELYDSLRLNWYYLKPGVVERDCYIAEQDHKKFPYEIVFTGSKGYHPEYPNRPALINWLFDNYKGKFNTYGNDGIRVVRGHELNVLYATAKIVIGDSCFGGRPNYSSDRLTEVIGRGGFIITPDVETLGIKDVVTYKYPDFSDLKDKIDYWLLPENQMRRLYIRDIIHEDVRRHHTYTDRAREILKIVFGG